MHTLILGNGHLGEAIASAVADAGWAPPAVLGRPSGGRHSAGDLIGADVVFDASRPDAVATNVETALDAGCRSFVVATTGWTPDEPLLERMLVAADAAAVVAPNLSLAMAVFMRLVERSAALFAPLEIFEPFVLEWHRRNKLDRPSGTARELVRRIDAGRGTADAGGSATRPIEVASVRAGASPGMHAVGWDAAGETLEIRHTARDRSAYAAGAVAAARWLTAERREPGIHPFDAVVDGLLERVPMGV
ncbi:MAG TPA: dihydrodipicolinate reductase C-terminal domain-containing protein [Candidatus Limnocylindrales bacterium]|nr:dihydrodipicolinate reductase C-terminal domain-containing protein [Candidatus Limnocylindrales bacterium]